MGNSCYLNAVLQCIAHTEPLFNYLQMQEHSQACTLSTGLLLPCTPSALQQRRLHTNDTLTLATKTTHTHTHRGTSVMCGHREAPAELKKLCHLTRTHRERQ